MLIGGIAAEVLFSGLAPGFAGLYQVNVTVPANVTAGPAIPVRVSVAVKQRHRSLCQFNEHAWSSRLQSAENDGIPPFLRNPGRELPPTRQICHASHLLR